MLIDADLFLQRELRLSVPMCSCQCPAECKQTFCIQVLAYKMMRSHLNSFSSHLCNRLLRCALLHFSPLGYTKTKVLTGYALNRFLVQLVDATILGNFAEVWLAKHEDDGTLIKGGGVGINCLTKIQLPTIQNLYGAMIAEVDYVLMGAGEYFSACKCCCYVHDFGICIFQNLQCSAAHDVGICFGIFAVDSVPLCALSISAFGIFAALPVPLCAMSNTGFGILAVVSVPLCAMSGSALWFVSIV